MFGESEAEGAEGDAQLVVVEMTVAIEVEKRELSVTRHVNEPVQSHVGKSEKEDGYISQLHLSPPSAPQSIDSEDSSRAHDDSDENARPESVQCLASASRPQILLLHRSKLPPDSLDAKAKTR